MAGDIRVAVFGNGFARSVVLPCLRHVPAMRVVGIASPNVARARETAQAFGIAHAAAEHREILDRTRPDLVFVVTPPHRHREQSLDALAAGAHVVCEKPTALNAAESADMARAAESTPGRLALLDHELRMDPRRRALLDRVRAGDLGDVLHATYTITSPGRRDSSSPWTWWSDRTQGGGALGALGSHAVDALRSYAGEVTAARGALHTWTTERRDATGAMRAVTADDYAVASLRFASGALGTITFSLVEGERVHRLTLAGTKRTARLDEQRPLAVEDDAHVMRDVAVPDELPSSEQLGIPDTDWARNFLRYGRAIAGAIAGGAAEIPGAATFRDGHANQQVLDAIRRSAEEDRWIAVG